MRAGVIIVSVIAHGAVIGPLLYWAPTHRAETATEIHEISVVPAPPPAPPPPPPAPAARTETVAPTRVRKPAAPRSPRVSAPAPTPGSGDTPSGSGSGSGSDSGSTGDGSGSGTAGSEIDRSGPPVPVDPSAARTMPYTEDATRARVSGDVVVSLEIDADGKVSKAIVKQGLGHGLDEIATKIATQLQFRPATDRSGAPVAGRVRWRFHFQPP